MPTFRIAFRPKHGAPVDARLLSAATAGDACARLQHFTRVWGIVRVSQLCEGRTASGAPCQRWTTGGTCPDHPATHPRA